MTPIFSGAAMFCAASVILSGTALAQTNLMEPPLPLTAAACQPLMAENLESCCAAENWTDLVLKDEVAFCPPLNATDTSSGRLGQELVAGEVDETPTGGIPGTGEDPAAATEDPAAAAVGNPGNERTVGESGEKADKGMAENDSDPATGEQGSSN